VPVVHEHQRGGEQAERKSVVPQQRWALLPKAAEARTIATIMCQTCSELCFAGAVRNDMDMGKYFVGG
jgi:hypothetical protein